MTDYIKNARLTGLSSDSQYSEAELIQTRDDIKESWQSLSDLKNKVFLEKQDALKAIDEKYKEEMDELSSHYALLLTLVR